MKRESPRPSAREGKRGGRKRAPARGARPRRQRAFYSIGEVCELLDLKPHVLRYWETQFEALAPSKNRAGNRVYRPADVELIGLIRRLVHEEQYTIQGARQRLAELRQDRAAGPEADRALLDEAFLDGLDRELERLIALLDSPSR